jgi:hypothetical protein
MRLELGRVINFEKEPTDSEIETCKRLLTGKKQLEEWGITEIYGWTIEKVKCPDREGICYKFLCECEGRGKHE